MSHPPQIHDWISSSLFSQDTVLLQTTASFCPEFLCIFCCSHLTPYPHQPSRAYCSGASAWCCPARIHGMDAASADVQSVYYDTHLKNKQNKKEIFLMWCFLFDLGVPVDIVTAFSKWLLICHITVWESEWWSTQTPAAHFELPPYTSWWPPLP